MQPSRTSPVETKRGPGSLRRGTDLPHKSSPTRSLNRFNQNYLTLMISANNRDRQSNFLPMSVWKGFFTSDNGPPHHAEISPRSGPAQLNAERRSVHDMALEQTRTDPSPTSTDATRTSGSEQQPTKGQSHPAVPSPRPKNHQPNQAVLDSSDKVGQRVPGRITPLKQIHRTHTRVLPKTRTRTNAPTNSTAGAAHGERSVVPDW
jgi:hypothetical protein